MHVTITGRHFDVSDVMRRYIDKKTPRLAKYFPQLLDLHVILSLEKFRTNVELVALASHLKVSVKAEGHQMQEAFDTAYAKLTEQLRRSHDKRRRAAHRRDKIKTRPVAEETDVV